MDFYINILGYGITNTAMVRLLNSYGVRCRIFDDRFVLFDSDSMNTYDNFKSMDKVHENLSIISPGIEPKFKYLEYFKNIISEYDFIYWLVGLSLGGVRSVGETLDSGGVPSVKMALGRIEENQQNLDSKEKYENIESTIESAILRHPEGA